MKKLILILSIVAFTVAATAQTPATQSKDPKQRASRITEKMTKELDLSDDVKTKVYDLNFSTAQKIIDIENKYSGNNKMIKREKRKARQEKNDQLKRLLTAEQFDKWKKLKKDIRRRNANSETNEDMQDEIEH